MPAKSEAQRRLLNAKFGHKWVKKHHFDNPGKLPEKVKTEALVVAIVDALLEGINFRQDTGDDEQDQKYDIMRGRLASNREFQTNFQEPYDEYLAGLEAQKEAAKLRQIAARKAAEQAKIDADNKRHQDWVKSRKDKEAQNANRASVLTAYMLAKYLGHRE